MDLEDKVKVGERYSRYVGADEGAKERERETQTKGKSQYNSKGQPATQSKTLL